MTEEALQDLTLDEVQSLNDIDRGDYLAFKRIFGTDGWKKFLQIIKDQQVQYMNQQLTAKDWDTVNRCRGAFAAHGAVLNFEVDVERTYHALANQSQTSDIDE